MESHQRASATWIKPECDALLTVCLPHWQRWWLPASAAFLAVVGWLCHNPPAWGCGEFSKTGRCRFHLFNGKRVRNDKASGMISPIHSLRFTNAQRPGFTIAAFSLWKWKTSEHNSDTLIILSWSLLWSLNNNLTEYTFTIWQWSQNHSSMQYYTQTAPSDWAPDSFQTDRVINISVNKSNGSLQQGHKATDFTLWIWENPTDCHWLFI